jgi:hypothetical protein
MSKTTNTKYNFALTMEIHVQSSNMWYTLGRCNYSVPLGRGFLAITTEEHHHLFALVPPNSKVSVPH